MEYTKALSYIKENKSGYYMISTKNGKRKKRLAISGDARDEYIFEMAKGKILYGYRVNYGEVDSWLNLEKIDGSKTNLVRKFKKYAMNASFDSAWIRMCLAADESKSCYENRLTTGTRIDGEIISLDAIAKFAPFEVEEFRLALYERRPYRSGRFNFRGYDGSLHLDIIDKDGSYYTKGDVVGQFSKEYRGCGNGYYYNLIDDEHFIGTDID